MSTPTRRLSRRSRGWRPSLRFSHGQKPRRVSLLTLAIGATALMLLVGFAIVCIESMAADRLAEPGFAAAESLPRREAVSLSVSVLVDGRTRFYRYVSATGHETRFFVIKTADGVVRAAFDACERCFRQRRGFRQIGDRLSCNACRRTLSAREVSVLKGGCNPVPLQRTIDGDNVIIRGADLESGSQYF